MAFVQTAFLAGFAALAVPVLIHLLFRRRSRRVDLGTLRFLKVVVGRNTRRRRIKRYVLLALRLACVALLVTLFARPYLLAAAAGGGDSVLVLLIDGSASMAAGGDASPRAEADAKAAELVEAGRSRRVETAVFDTDVRPVDSDRLAGPAKAFGGTNYARALAWAADRVSRAADGEIVLLTDLQRSGLDRTDDAVPPAGLPVRVVDVGRPVTNDLAVIDAAVPRTVVRPGEDVTLTVTAANGGPFAADDVSVVVRVASGGKRQTFRQRVSLPPGETAAVEFELPDLAAGLWSGSVTLEARDDLAFDDVRHFAVLAADRDRVLLVDREDAESPLRAETYFLDAALRLSPPGGEPGDGPYVPTTLTGPGLPEDLTPYRAVLLADPDPLTAADARRLRAFVEAGGGLLVFTGEHVTQESTAGLRAAGLTPGKIGEAVTRSGRPARLADWDITHPVFAAFADPQSGDLRRLAFDAYTKVAPAKDARVLARFDGDPAVVETSVGRGRVIWFASAADRDWGDWTRSPLFLPLVYQMVGRLTGATDGGPVRSAIVGAADAPAEPGVYDRGGYALVVNPDPREADLDRCTPEEFAARFDLAAPGTPAARDPSAAATVSGRELRRDEIWPWLLIGVMGLLLAEGFLGNRTEA